VAANHLHISVGDGEQDRHVGRGGPEVAQEVKRTGVSPLRIVNDH
jgi:hypothetical protein